MINYQELIPKAQKHFKSFEKAFLQDVEIFYSSTAIKISDNFYIGITFYHKKTNKASIEMYIPIETIMELK